MIVLNKKKILIVLYIFIVIILISLIDVTVYGESQKTIILDAGHGEPDGRCGK